MRILAVSDKPDAGIEHLATHTSQKLSRLDAIISCGDLEPHYLELLVDGIHRPFLFVRGNHHMNGDCDKQSATSTLWERIGQGTSSDGDCYIAGHLDLHGRIEVLHDTIFAGFGGSMWYGGRGFEFTEKQMASVVRRVIRAIRWQQWRDRLLRRPEKKIIIISHAPPFHVHDLPDPCHTGFKCFHTLINKLSPRLWMHGHIHTDDVHTNQATKVGNTLVVNAYSHKFFSVTQNLIDFSYSYEILDTRH